MLQFGQLSRDGAFVFIDMELCDINLERYIVEHYFGGVTGRIRSHDVPMDPVNILYQITNGLAYIHQHLEVHRDLSPHNSKSLLFEKCFDLSTSTGRMVEDKRLWSHVRSDVLSTSHHSY